MTDPAVCSEAEAGQPAMRREETSVVNATWLDPEADHGLRPAAGQVAGR